MTLAFRRLCHASPQLTGNPGAALTLSGLPLWLATLGIGMGLAAWLGALLSRSMITTLWGRFVAGCALR